MKYLVASDIHGSLKYAQLLLERFEKEKADKLILLGDLYYHGPRNPLPEDYNPAGTAKLFNAVKEKLVVVKGNCDSEVDEMISEFKFLPHYTLKRTGVTVIFVHGHRFNLNNPPKRNFDVLVYGHEHTGYIKKQGNKFFVNPGSVSLPKGGTPRSYIILMSDTIILKDLDGQVLQQTGTKY